MEKVQGVEDDPERHDAHLHQDEDPAADQPSEVVSHAVGEGELALDLAIEVTDRRVVVLVLDEVAGDVFDLSGD